MNEVREDYFDDIREKNKARPKGYKSNPSLPTEKQLKAECSPVVVIRPPRLPTLKERLNWARDSRKITIDTLCKQAGCSKGQYFRIRSGEQRLRKPLAEKLAEVLGVSYDWLTDGLEIAASKKKDPQKPVRKRKKTVQLHIEGKYMPEQLIAILTGFDNQFFYICLDMEGAGSACQPENT